MYDMISTVLIGLFVISLLLWVYLLIKVGDDSLDKYFPFFVITIIPFWVIIMLVIANAVVGVLLAFLILLAFFIVLRME